MEIGFAFPKPNLNEYVHLVWHNSLKYRLTSCKDSEKCCESNSALQDQREDNPAPQLMHTHHK